MVIATIGIIALGVHFEDDIFTEKREVTYLEVNAVKVITREKVVYLLKIKSE